MAAEPLVLNPGPKPVFGASGRSLYESGGGGRCSLPSMNCGRNSRLTEKGLANRLLLTEEQVLENCRKVQAANGLPQSDALVPLTLEKGRLFQSQTSRSRWRRAPARPMSTCHHLQIA
jgi:hypothetical protein